MGSVRPRAETGKLFIDFRFQGQRCREQTLLDDSVANRRRLEQLLDKIEHDISVGTFDYSATFPNSPRAKKFARSSEQINGAPLFSEFVDEWWQENAFRWKRSGVKNMRSTLDKHLLPTFGVITVNQIGKGDVLKFRARLAELPGRSGNSLSNKRINNIMQPLKSILDEAADRYGFVSPFRTIKRLPVNKPDVNPFSLAEVMRFLDEVRFDFRNYYTVRFFSGLRTGEIDGLRWKHVDFERGLIYVREAFTYGEMDTTKTPGSDRDVQMSSLVRDALLEQRKLTISISEFVFCNRDGKQLDQANVTKRIWYPTLARLGMEKRRPYQTRHTAATLWLAAGENPEWVARQLGHSSSQMLFQTYARYIPNATRQDGSAIESLIQSCTTQENSDE
ncbi:MAG: Arm DNA-binding domain-containing protein [Mariprofundus sp.]